MAEQKSKPESKSKKKQVEYSFPNRSRCPRCRVTNTEAYATRQETQYRRCRGATCGKRYTVKADRI